jgi:hypothetical protein
MYYKLSSVNFLLVDHMLQVPKISRRRYLKVDKPTCHIGWKHVKKNVYSVVPRNQGGAGTGMTLAIARDATLAEVTAQLTGIFFPNGLAANGLLLEDVDVSLGKFTNELLPSVVNGEAFTFAAYRDSEAVSPLRIYLLTKVH